MLIWTLETNFSNVWIKIAIFKQSDGFENIICCIVVFQTQCVTSYRKVWVGFSELYSDRFVLPETTSFVKLYAEIMTLKRFPYHCEGNPPV